MASALVVAACGGEEQDADEKAGNYTVEVTKKEFPKDQRLAEMARMTLTVRNTGQEQVPNVVVTLQNQGGSDSGTDQGIEAFGYRTEQAGVADASRPVWIVDAGPDQVLPEGPGGAVTAYVNTWALGPLNSGDSKTFTWDVTPIREGSYTVDWRVGAGLDGKAVAKLENDKVPQGSFKVNISNTPAQARVDENGEVVREPAN